MPADAANPKPPPSGWRLIPTLVPALIFWAVPVGWLAYELYTRSHLLDQADESNLVEWLDESRVFRKSLPELVRDYLALRARGPNEASPEEIADRADEIREQLKVLADPTRAYQGLLPLFPEIYRLEVRFQDPNIEPIVWVSPAPMPRQQTQDRVRPLDHRLLGEHDARAVVHCEYRLHAFSLAQRREAEATQNSTLVGALVLVASIGTLAWVYYYLRRERRRELQQYEAMQDKEHAERLLLENELRREELDRTLLQQSLEIARQQNRAAEAERSALELKSQLYASIGIMAGSYAHNIKNLLVRPNDLLARCLEADGLSPPQTSMLQEVRVTLGTVTERLQQILRTVRRDPGRSEVTRLDLNELIRDTQRTWEEMGRDKWKLVVTADIAEEPLPIQGDHSHLQQAIENLLFNARDATFEMRNQLREQARGDRALSPAARKQALIDAAGWKGTVSLRTYREGDRAVLEVADNGIGMTEEVRQRCTQTHFSTKRDNALYEGYNAGMGLGLSFVAMVLEHHGATLEIESRPLKGAIFRIRFPLAA